MERQLKKLIEQQSTDGGLHQYELSSVHQITHLDMRSSINNLTMNYSILAHCQKVEHNRVNVSAPVTILSKGWHVL